MSGVCSVDIITDTFITGNVRGSCFPPSFGGKCSGIPKGCDTCLDICKDQLGRRFIIPIGGDGNVVPSETIKPTELVVDPSLENKPSMLTCSYKCKPSGSCSVRVKLSR